jgi:hypothetical protein
MSLTRPLCEARPAGERLAVTEGRHLASRLEEFGVDKREWIPSKNIQRLWGAMMSESTMVECLVGRI